MAKKENPSDPSVTDFTSDLIKALNKEHGNGEKIAYNLAYDDAPTKVHRWIPTGIRQLNYNIANRRNGGLPEGRIIEIFGPPSIGKSHVAAQIAKETQKMGGLVAYIDSENATSKENLELLGVNIEHGFIYLDAQCTEKVFALIESIIVKTKSLRKDTPVTIIWDSVAGTSPKAEILGDYDKDSVGLQARALSKGFRKITQVIGNNRVTLVCLNQTRTAIGQMYGDNQKPSGGMSIPFHSSVRIKLGAGSQIFPGGDTKKDPIGINVTAKTIKNKISPPFRSCSFQIHFGVGIKEHEELFDLLRSRGPVTVNGMKIEVEGTGSWKNFTVVDATTGEVKVEKKFYKKDFDTEVLSDPACAGYAEDLIEAHLVKRLDGVTLDDVDIDDESLVEVESLADELKDLTGSPEE